ADAGDAPALEPVVERALRAEVGRRVAQLAHHIAPDGRRSLEVLVNDAVVADEGKGLHDDLAGIARIGQGFQIARHARGKHQLAQALARRADALSLEKLPVSQQQISHRIPLFLFRHSVAAMTALMVCMRFSASSKTMDRSLRNTSSVTSMQEMPNLSY